MSDSSLMASGKRADRFIECEEALDGIADPAAFVRDAKAVVDYYRTWPGCCDSIGLSDAVEALARHFPEDKT